jgi:hypothetical protein
MNTISIDLLHAVYSRTSPTDPCTKKLRGFLIAIFAQRSSLATSPELFSDKYQGLGIFTDPNNFRAVLTRTKTCLATAEKVSMIGDKLEGCGVVASSSRRRR